MPGAPVRSWESRARRLTIAAAVAAAAAALAGLGYGIGLLDASAPRAQRDLSAAEARLVRSELAAALAARRRLDWRGLHRHLRTASDVANQKGQTALAQTIGRAAGLGCFAAATEFHLLRALRLVDRASPAHA